MPGSKNLTLQDAIGRLGDRWRAGLSLWQIILGLQHSSIGLIGVTLDYLFPTYSVAMPAWDDERFSVAHTLWNE